MGNARYRGNSKAGPALYQSLQRLEVSVDQFDVGREACVHWVDPDLRAGVISISHGWGGLLDDEEDPTLRGSAVNRLIDADRNFEAICAMPHMSAIPVNAAKLAPPVMAMQQELF